MPPENKSCKIIPVPMGQSNAYLVSGINYTFLVDAGYANKIHLLEEKLKENGLEFTDIDLIILTHTHYDYVGCLDEIKEKRGAKVLVHKDEAGCLKKGYTLFPKGTMLFSKFVSKIGNRFFAGTGNFFRLNLISASMENMNFQNAGFRSL